MKIGKIKRSRRRYYCGSAIIHITSNDQGGAWHMEHLFIDICTYFVVQLLSWYFIISYSWSPTVIFVIIQNDSTTVCWYYVESGDGRDYWDYEADNNVIEVWLSCAQGATLLWNSFNGNQYQWDFYWKPFLIGFCCWMNKLGKHRRFETHFKKYTLKNYTLEHLEDIKHTSKNTLAKTTLWSNALSRDTDRV